MLRVVCPYVPGLLRERTQAALEGSVGVHEFRPEMEPDRTLAVNLSYEPLDPNDPLAYGRLVALLWRDAVRHGDDLAIVEQDIEVGPATLYDFRACSHPYCGNPFAWGTNVGVAMGCTRFRAEFVAAHQNAVEEALAVGPHFRNFDVVFQRRVLAERYGWQPHVHSPVVHLNEAKRLRPGASPVPLAGVPVGDIGELL